MHVGAEAALVFGAVGARRALQRRLFPALQLHMPVEVALPAVTIAARGACEALRGALREGGRPERRHSRRAVLRIPAELWYDTGDTPDKLK